MVPIKGTYAELFTQVQVGLCPGFCSAEALRPGTAKPTATPPQCAVILMKTWLRLTLITLTVGGGFTGVTVSLQSLVSTHGARLMSYLLIAAFVALFTFVTISGLMFVQNPQRTRPLLVAMALQIPWVSSPIVAYKFTAGFQVVVGLFGGRLTGGFRFGSDFEIFLFQRLPWGAGINLFALAILILLIRTIRLPNPPLRVAPADSLR